MPACHRTPRAASAAHIASCRPVAISAAAMSGGDFDGDEWPPPLELMVYSGLDNLVDAEAYENGQLL